MDSEEIKVSANHSARLDSSGLILSVRQIHEYECELVVGYPGLPNATHLVQTGDAILYETPSSGMFEVRVLTFSYVDVTFLVTHISPHGGLAAAFVTSDPNNTPFTPEEAERISQSIDTIKNDLLEQALLQPDQLDLISRKLDEIQEASKRLGRKDWINYAAGMITSVCVSAAFSQETTKSIFVSLNAAFTWLFGNILQIAP